MRNIINIQGNNQSFPYLIEYKKGNTKTDSHDIYWSINHDVIRLFQGGVTHYRNKNDWHDVKELYNRQHDYIPNNVNISNIKIYLPEHSPSTYLYSIKYIVTVNTWINGEKIDFGSFMFKPNDAVAINTGTIKKGNNEYHEYVSFDIIDPFYLMYSDDWLRFRNIVCKEPTGINNTGSALQVSLFIVDEYNDFYLIKEDWIGGCTNFSIADDDDFLSLNLSNSLDPLGLKLDLTMNKEYNWFLTYLSETYCLNVSKSNIKYEIVIKNKEGIMVGPTVNYNATEDFGIATQYVTWEKIIDNESLGLFFSSWDNFEEGWNFVASLSICDNDVEMFNIVSNEIPITQTLFSRYINGSEKIIDLNDMNIIQYNVVNKIENKVVQIERPNASKSNIVQPVFYRVKDLETLTLHPLVTENISINLDDYKSKVERFILLIEGCKFEQIGANKYGILFKITANTLPASAVGGTYYVLDENSELITTGKYNCIR